MCDRGNNVAGIELGYILLNPARPHDPFEARPSLQRIQGALDQRAVRQLAHTHRCNLAGRNAKPHFVLGEIDNKKFQLGACNLLLLDRHDLAHAMGPLHDELTNLEAVTFCRLFLSHSELPLASRLGGPLRPGVAGQAQTRSRDETSVPTIPAPRSRRCRTGSTDVVGRHNRRQFDKSARSRSSKAE